MEELELLKKLVKDATHPKDYDEKKVEDAKFILGEIKKVQEDINNLPNLNDTLLAGLVISKAIKNSDALLLKSYKINIKYNKVNAVNESKIKVILDECSRKYRSFINSQTNEKAIALSKKIENGLINLTESDIDELFNIVRKAPDLSIEEKRDLLIYTSLNLETRIIDEYEDDYIEIEDSKKGLTIEELTLLFGKHNYDVSLLNEKNTEELLKRGNYEQIDKILTLLDNNDIDLTDNNNHNILLDKQDCLREILIRSNEHCTEEILNFAKEYGITDTGEKDGIINFYKLVCTPGKFALKQRPYKKKINTGVIIDPIPSTDKFAGTHQDFMANVKYFSGICKELYGDDIDFIKRYYEKRNGVLLEYPHEKILEIVSILESYGFNKRDYFSQATTVFSTIHQADVLDFAIETGMYNYIKQNPSKMVMDKSLFDMLYVASLDKERFLLEEKKSDFVGNQTVQYELNKKEINKYLEAHPIDDSVRGITLDLDMVKGYEQTIKAYPFNISIDDKDANIKLLEENFKVNDLLYEIGGVKVSRLKVLRVYNALKENPLEDEHNKFIYAVTRNTYISNEDYAKMVSAYNSAASTKTKSLGGNNDN